MRTRDKQRIFKRFMRGEAVVKLWSSAWPLSKEEIESIIREGVKAGWDTGKEQA